ncbi:hypothetical protein [Devosia faecipullorum]|uniref:hypothetical protein n=1 Tax=Devosia faecipullorum TaxID=2755039 RepID=UPI00187B1C08|nr:hypothetical protein [Devosia faecipullorum]MBE7733729.1 hypothetical protein [Devosia faecipullorum]
MHTRNSARVKCLAVEVHAGNIYVNRNQFGTVVGSQPLACLQTLPRDTLFCLGPDSKDIVEEWAMAEPAGCQAQAAMPSRWPPRFKSSEMSRFRTPNRSHFYRKRFGCARLHIWLTAKTFLRRRT